jgi:hypothetical protein
MLQDGADAGHQPWLLSPEQVATSYGAAELGLYQPVARRVGPNADEVGATCSEWVAKLHLAQPVRQGAAGVWGHHPDREPRSRPGQPEAGWQKARPLRFPERP